MMIKKLWQKYQEGIEPSLFPFEVQIIAVLVYIALL
jgi:hypothetical protein